MAPWDSEEHVLPKLHYRKMHLQTAGSNLSQSWAPEVMLEFVCST